MSWTVGFRPKNKARIRWAHTFYFATREEAEGQKEEWERNDNPSLEFTVLEANFTPDSTYPLGNMERSYPHE